MNGHMDGLLGLLLALGALIGRRLRRQGDRRRRGRRCRRPVDTMKEGTGRAARRHAWRISFSRPRPVRPSPVSRQWAFSTCSRPGTQTASTTDPRLAASTCGKFRRRRHRRGVSGELQHAIGTSARGVEEGSGSRSTTAAMGPISPEAIQGLVAHMRTEAAADPRRADGQGEQNRRFKKCWRADRKAAREELGRVL